MAVMILKKKMFKIGIFLICFSAPCYYAQSIIVGTDFTDAFAALVSSDGVSTPIVTGAVGNGSLRSVAINSAGVAIIGGLDNGNTAFAALVSPAGVSTPIVTGATGVSLFNRVAINNAGAAIIGGVDNGNTTPFAALVSPAGVSTPIVTGAVGNGSILGVAINSTGAAIIGGLDNGNTTPFAALVSPAGVSTPIVTGAVGNGVLLSVAINDTGAAIIGGQDNGSTTPFAALVSPSGVSTPIVTGAAGNGFIRSVAINSTGAAIIGGVDNSSSSFAALVSPAGVSTPIVTGAVGNGDLFSVAINSTGAAIIGGRDNGNTTPFAALVSPSGTSTVIATGAIGNGLINSVAIDSTGVGLIGGIAGGAPFAAFVSPLGISTPIILSTISTGTIASVAIGPSANPDVPASIFEAIVPKSYSNGNFANALLALSSQVLPNHISFQRAPTLANTSDCFYLKGNCPCPPKTKYSVWADPFGYYASHQQTNAFPHVTDWVGGALVGFDYYGIQNALIGCGAAYAYDHAHFGQGKGHADTNQELLTLYGSWIRNHFFINAAVWGGIYQMHNKRNSIEGITSTSNVGGWMLLPHLEIGIPFYMKKNWFRIDPFVMLDWANNWQGHVREKGSAGFNLLIGHQYTSILRSEAGLRFYEYAEYEWGTVILEEKGSWANLLPLHAGPVQTAFIGSASSFPIEVFNNRTQNLGVAQFSTKFMPCNSKYPYGSINYQGEFGSAFQSHLVSLELGKFF